MSKHIFVTGGVVSGLGKGITAASLGRLLKCRGYKVAAQKLDPYMNIDPGTMSPLQHGEVFVTEDGAETDLDLGHYERFIDEDLNKYSNLTSGKTFWSVLQKERNGEYLGSTVQIIPHVTNEIKSFIYALADKTKADVVITEIGGTTGDIESQPFLEAIRQISHEVGKENCLFIHVTLVPYIKGSEEHKSKPTQHSVKELMGSGIFPDIIVCRADEKIEEGVLNKIALFCNVKKDCVIENTTVPVLYEAPIMLSNQGLDKVALRELGLEEREADLTEWNNMLSMISSSHRHIKIALVGKYIALHDAYLSVIESLKHAGWHNSVQVSIKWVDSEDVMPSTSSSLFNDVDGILIPGGFGSRGIEGKIEACKYAREHDIPYLGICLGMQIAVIEYARNVLGYCDANSSEFDPDSKHKVIDLMETQKDVTQKGGTMRLGAYPCKIKDGLLLSKVYNGEKLIYERHRHRYEFSNVFRKELEDNGLSVVGTSPDDTLVEAVSIENNHFFLGVQYHPEFKSRPNRPSPVFYSFIKAAANR